MEKLQQTNNSRDEELVTKETLKSMLKITFQNVI